MQLYPLTFKETFKFVFIIVSRLFTQVTYLSPKWIKNVQLI